MTDALPDDELRALAEAATPGPWVAEPDTHAGRVWVQMGKGRSWGPPDLEPLFQARPPTQEDKAQKVADAALIAAMRNALPSLLDRLAHVEARTAEAVEAALTEAADALEGTLGTTPAPPRNLWEFRCWLRDRAAQVRAARGATEGRGGAGEVRCWRSECRVACCYPVACSLADRAAPADGEALGGGER